MSTPTLLSKPAKRNVTLSVASDTICPWCYVGKRRLERAIAAVADEGIACTVTWLPFELNADMPLEGLDRKAYRSAKFGSWEQSLALDRGVAREGAKDDVEFHHERMLRTPNTLASHRLIWLAGEYGGPVAQGQVVEALFAAYFTDGRDIGDLAVLREIALESGLSADVIDRFDRDEGVSEVERLARRVARLGITGVPTLLVGERPLFSGAQSVPVIVDALRILADEPASLQVADAAAFDGRC